jgi:PAS domain S-box-containing protein
MRAPATTATEPAYRRLPPLAGALLVLAAGLAIAYGASRLVAGHLDREAAARFEARGAALTAHLERRLDDLRNLILGLQGLFIASSHVSREEFNQYSATLDLAKRLEGLQALSFQRRILQSEKAAFVERVRNDRSLDPNGFPDFTIRPPGERAEYLVIDFIEPLALNRSALGFDAATQAGNADAIRLARDSGRMHVSEPFQIVQSPDGAPRVVLRAPVYRRGAPAHSTHERRLALKGFVVLTVETRSAFSNYFNAMLAPGERLLIEDAGLAEGSSIVARKLVAELGGNDGRPVLSKRVDIEFGGRKWALQYSADAAWLAGQPGRGHVPTVLAGGAVISLLLAALYYALASARNRAWRLVEARTRELRQSEERFRTATDVSTEWYWEQDRDHRFTGFIGKSREATAIPSDHFMGRTRWEVSPGLMSEAQWAAHRADLEARRPFSLAYSVRDPQGTIRWVESKGQPRFDEGGAFIGYHGTAREITRQVETENRLIQQASLLRTVLEHMNQGISVVDAELKMVGCNRRFIELLGFPEALSRDGTPFEDFVRYNAERGEYGPGDTETLVRERVVLARHFLPHRFKRSRPDGTVIDVIGTPLPGGGMVTTYTDISEQERTQQALARSEHFHRSLVEISPDAIFAYRDGIVLFANPAAARMFGASRPKDMEGLGIEPLVAPEDWPQVRERIESLLAGRLAQTPLTEKRYLTLDGRRLTVESSGTLIDLEGRPAVLTVARDITERKRAENALRESEERFRRIVEQSPISMAIVALDGTIEFINRKAVDTFGYRPEDIPDMDRWWQLAYPDPAYRHEVVTRWVALVEKAIAENHEIEPGQYRIACKDGSVKIMEIFGVPVSGKVFVMFDDVTEREAAAARVLRERDFRQHIIESIPGVFYLISPDGRFLLWNRNFETVTGHDAQAMAGAQPLDFFDGTDKDLIARRIGAVFESGSATAEAPFRTADGTMRPYFFTGERIILEDGSPALVGVGFDISVRKRAEEALARQSAILQATLEAMDQGISVVDADLNMSALNKRFYELLDLPESLAAHGASFADFARYNAERGEYGPCDIEAKVQEMVERARHPEPHHFRRTRPGGRIIEIRGNPLPGGGFVTTYTDVTEQEQAQAALRLSEQRYRNLIELSPDAIFVHRRHIILIANPAAARLWGIDSVEQAIGRSLLDFVHPDSQELVRQRIQRLESDPTLFRLPWAEQDYRRADGAAVPVEGSATRIELEDGPAILSVIRDISARKEAETLVRRERDFRQRLIESIPGIFFLFDPAGRFLLWNKNLENVLGMGAEEIAAGHTIMLYAESDREAIRRATRQAFAEGAATTEAILVTRRGERIPYFISGLRIDIDGQQSVIGLGLDISERKRAETALRESETRFRSIFEKALNGIAFAGLDGTLIEANDSLAQLLGYARTELEGMNIGRFTHPDDLSIEAVFLDEMQRGLRDFYRMDKRYLTRLGHEVWVDLLVKLIRNERGEPVHVVGMVADITERKLAEQVIRDLNETLEQRVRERTAELEASNQELESFSYSVSHDLRAPLRALNGFSHLLEEEYAHHFDANGLNYLARIRAASQKMGELIDDLLDLARVTRQELKRQPVDLSRLAQDVLNGLQEQDPGRRVDWRGAAGLGTEADPVLMRVLLENLLGNAWKFTARQAEARIEFGAQQLGEAPVFFVRDNGAGFDPAYADKLFKPFQRLHRPDEFAGTGIGLATVHRIVRRHGGRVWAEGRPGEGASFFFTLP